MKLSEWRGVFPLSLTILLVFCVDVDAAQWYRGNTHTHTLNSDGDSSPDGCRTVVSRAWLSVLVHN